MRIQVFTHVFEAENSDSLVNVTEFKSLRDYSLWLASADSYFQNSVRFGQFHQVQIVTHIEESILETHIEMVRGELRVAEYNVTPNEHDFLCVLEPVK